jgi:hypothetical protein
MALKYKQYVFSKEKYEQLSKWRKRTRTYIYKLFGEGEETDFKTFHFFFPLYPTVCILFKQQELKENCKIRSFG